jgi:hypothetical protein
VQVTPAHRVVLKAIGRRGAGRDELGQMVESRQLHELITAGLVTFEPHRLHETPPEAMARQGERIIARWFLTPAGARAIGVSPEELRDAFLRAG